MWSGKMRAGWRYASGLYVCADFFDFFRKAPLGRCADFFRKAPLGRWGGGVKAGLKASNLSATVMLRTCNVDDVNVST